MLALLAPQELGLRLSPCARLHGPEIRLLVAALLALGIGKREGLKVVRIDHGDLFLG